MPISSSRTSEREQSPIRGGRKHARNADASHDDHGPSLGRLSPDEDDDEDRYGSRFSRNGMGNGGVFGVTGQYYSGNPVSTESGYGATNILPMFQNSSFHNMHDPNHLEDASVLLSMAYPGGVPGSNTSPNAGSSEQRTEWDGGQTGGILSEDTPPVAAASTSSSHNDKDATPSRESNFNSGAVDTPARPAAPGAVLPESMGNLAGTMKWLSGNVQDVNNPITPSNWPSSDSTRPLSPFNLSSLFATSPFGLSNIPSPAGVALSNETTAMAIAAAAAAAQTDDQSGNDNNNNNNNSTIVTLNNPTNTNANNAFAQSNPFVAALLNQLAMNDVPETLANPNPERPLLRLANKDLVIRAGQECPRNSRF